MGKRRSGSSKAATQRALLPYTDVPGQAADNTNVMPPRPAPRPQGILPFDDVPIGEVKRDDIEYR